MEDIETKIKECKSYSEVGRILGYNYYNSKVKQVVIDFCFQYNIDIEKQISNWKNRKAYCLNCGKEIVGDHRFKKKFCSNSCSASYTNKMRPPKSEKERNKISNGLVNYYKSHTRIITTKDGKYNCTSKLLSQCISDGLILNPLNVDYKDKLVCERKYNIRKCVVCGKLFKPFLNKSGNLYKGETCSEECSKKLRSLKTKEIQEKLVSEGKHKGWKTRNVLSYAERFWISVLDKNNISFIPNKPIKQENGISNYFLDFYIKKGNQEIDLEIDGKTA